MIAPTALCPVCHTPHTSAATTCQTCGLIFATLAAEDNTPIPLRVVAPDFALQPGQQLDNGRYTVQRSLVRGGMGILYLATDHTAFDRTVVLKVLRVSARDARDSASEAEMERFVQEARTLAALKHPAIPQIMAFFQDGAYSCIVMEYIEGRDLFQSLTHVDEATGRLIVGKPYPAEDVLRWGIELCRILEYLASRQPPVIHHDIKPANLMRDANSNALFLVDFGTAHTRQFALGDGVPQRMDLYGTPGYAPPEQYRGTSRTRSDVYALAATLYHLLTDDDPGQHRFTFPRLAQFGRMGQVLGGALNKYVDERPTATKLREQLEALPGAASARVCITPDGTVTTDESELVAWCEQHWCAALTWLYPGIHISTGNTLIEEFERAWGTRDLVHKLRLSADVYATDPHQGLDAVLALLDPQGFGAAQPSLTANHAGVDFGTHDSATASEQTLAFTNTSRRAFAAELLTPSWARVMSPSEPATLTFAPKQSNTIKLLLDDHLNQTGFLSGELTVTTEMVTMLRVPLRAQIPHIVSITKPPVQQLAQPGQHSPLNKGHTIGFVITLFMLIASGFHLSVTSLGLVMFLGLALMAILGFLMRNI